MLRFLKLCADIEETVGQIYQGLAESVDCDADLKKLWMKMARDEEAHAKQIRFAMRLPLRQVFKSQNSPTLRMESLLAKAQDLLRQVQGKSLSVEDALKLSIRLEGDFMEAHIGCAEFLDESMKKMMLSLASEDEAHVSLLHEYCRGFCKDVVRTA